MALKYIPITVKEIKELGWDYIDVIIISGDAYVDHPSFGSAVIARVLEREGLRVAVVPQPDVKNPQALKAFGRPRLFYGVTGGNVDSTLSRYTAFKKVRNDDPFSPDGEGGLRPEKATIVYCNYIKQVYKDVPVVIGGIEASMRRFAHYDYWSNKVRRSIIEDSRADLLVYGMGEYAIVETARRIKEGQALSGIKGTMEITTEAPAGISPLTPEEEVVPDKSKFAEFYKNIYLNRNEILVQPAAKRYIVQYPPYKYSTEELDAVYSLPFAREVHPAYNGKKIPAFEMIRFSINSHRGCVSGCAFCSIALHQGRQVISRSKKSIMSEAEKISAKKYFKGHITDIGGPSANMYRTVCKNNWNCKRESCLFPSICKNLKADSAAWVDLLKSVKQLNGVKHVTIGSGIRYDLLMKENPAMLRELIKNHVGGQLKIAPEHVSHNVLNVMRKNPLVSFNSFVKTFFNICKEEKKKYYIIPYLMSNHPGSTLDDMKKMKRDLLSVLKFVPDQVQSFIPLPMTLSSVIYYTGIDPLTGEKIFSEKDMNRKRGQHEIFF